MMGSAQVLLGLHLRIRCEVRCHPLRLLQEATCARRWCRSSSWIGVRPLPLAWTPRRAAAPPVAVHLCCPTWLQQSVPQIGCASWLRLLVAQGGCASRLRIEVAHRGCALGWRTVAAPWSGPCPRRETGSLVLEVNLLDCPTLLWKLVAEVGCRSCLRRSVAQVACASCSRNDVAQLSCVLQSCTAVVHWYCGNVRQRLALGGAR